MRRVHLGVLLLFSVLAIALTYPLVTRLATHVPGSDTWAYDEYTFLWNIWWFKAALIDQHRSPLHTGLLFYPLGLDLVLYTFNLVAAALALPLMSVAGAPPGAASGVPLSSNLINLLSSVFGGYGAFLLARYLLRMGVGRWRTPQATVGPGYALVRDVAAVLAGLIYAFASNRSIYLALGHYMIVTTQWVPFFALYLIRTLDGQRSRDAIMAGLFAGLALLTDMIYGVLLALIALPFLLSQLRQQQIATRPSQLSSASTNQPANQLTNQPTNQPINQSIKLLLSRLVLIGAVAALVSAPLLIPTVREGLKADYTVEGWGDADKLSADLSGLVTPTALHPLWGSDWPAALRAVQTGESRFSDINTVFLGYVTLALALLGVLVGRRQVKEWLAVAIIAGMLALGPLLQINGRSVFDLDGLQVTFPLPYILLHYLPFIKGFRAPNRFSIVLMLALAVLAAHGLAWLLGHLVGLRGLERRWLLFTEASKPSIGRRVLALLVGASLSGAVVFEHLAVPMPLTDARVPAVYQRLAAQPGDFAIMQLPMGWRNGFGVYGAENTRVEWYQAVHGRPILSGNTSRNPPFKFEYFQRLPLIRALASVETYQYPDEETDRLARQSAGELMALWNVRYLVVNPPVPGRYPYVDTWQAARDYALDVLPVDPQPVWREDGIEVYVVHQPPLVLPFSLDLGSQDTAAYRGPGWSSDEANIAGASGIWGLGQEAELFLPLHLQEPRPLLLTLRVQPFSYPDASPQALTVEFNDISLGTRAVTPGWQELEFAVPAKAAREGLNRLRLRFASSARPVDVLPGQGQIGSTGVRSPVDIEINSGGMAQDIAFITVVHPDGRQEDASAGRRGYNLAAIDPRRGRVLAVRGFDTWANEYEAARLAEFVAGLPQGTIVVAAARDDASRSLTDEAVAALASLGSQVDLRQTPGYGHALIGVKGAAPGTAAEVTGPDGAFLRLASDRRPLAIAVDWLRLEAAP